MIEPNASVLVINVARIGDTLLATPVLRAARAAYPLGRIGCLAHPRRAELLRGLDWLDELGAITSKTAWARGRFEGQRWDYALVYGSDMPLIRYAARVARRVIAFEPTDSGAQRLLWRAVAKPAALTHVVHEHFLLAAPLGISRNDGRLSYRPLEPELAAARTVLTRLGVAGCRPLIGLQVASFPTKAYRDWPLGHFAELGRRTLTEFSQARILILGGPESRTKADALIAELGERAVSAAGRFSLRESAALMAQLDLYIGVDTGPTHLAGALGIPMVALYHCRHPGRRFAPLGHPRLRVIEHPASDADCQPSTSMAAISVDEVWAEARSLLDTAN